MALHDLLDKINQNTEVKIARLNSEFERQVAEIKATYVQQKEENSALLTDKTNKNLNKLRSRTRTFVNMESKKELLKEKHAVLEEVFRKSVLKIVNSSEYTSILEGLLKKAGKSFNKGTVYVAEAHTGLMKDLLTNINSPFVLGEYNKNIKGGFILESENIEVNFSVSSILRKELWEDLEIELNNTLFA